VFIRKATSTVPSVSSTVKTLRSVRAFWQLVTLTPWHREARPSSRPLLGNCKQFASLCHSRSHPLKISYKYETGKYKNCQPMPCERQPHRGLLLRAGLVHTVLHSVRMFRDVTRLSLPFPVCSTGECVLSSLLAFKDFFMKFVHSLVWVVSTVGSLVRPYEYADITL
jgi:hypothetical protein